MDYTLNIVRKCWFFFMFKHSWAPNRSWKIFSWGPEKSWIFLSVKEWEPWSPVMWSITQLCLSCWCVWQSNSETDSSTSELITAVYLESSNAVDYIHNGLSLLLPVLQLAIIKAHPLFTSASD